MPEHPPRKPAKSQEPREQARQGSEVPIEAFRADARNLSAADFEERHGSAFLLVTAAELRTPAGPAATMVNLADLDEPTFERTAAVSLLVHPVLRTDRSLGDFVAVGRTSNNDVVIPDLSVSRFHAFLKPVGDGSFRIQDANSTNGTGVNGSSVPAQGQGPPVQLKAGDNLRLGHVELTFVSAPALREFVLARDS